MSYYRRNAEANRDALFGPPSGGSKSKPKSSASRSSGNSVSSTRSNATSRTTSTMSSTAAVVSIGSRSTFDSVESKVGTNSYTSTRSRSSKSAPVRTLSGTVKLQKMKEAEEYRAQAKKAMTRGIFSKPDPVIAGTYYKRAADIYRQCGENRLERLHRIASADCQRGQEAYAIAASEYTRAAELAEISDEKEGRKRSESYQLHKNAADAWKNLNEMGRAGESLIKAALGLLIGVDPDAPNGAAGEKAGYGTSEGNMDKKVLIALSEAVEAHVPDPLNRYASLRKCGTSIYKPDSNTPAAVQNMRRLAYQNIVTTAYGHETVSKAVRVLIEFREYASALYAAGAVTALLEHENTATVSLSRAYLSETILQLAMNDVVAADLTFMQVHLQQNSYLSSRECKLAEELIRAMKTMDADALESAKLENRSALANLDPILRSLVLDLQTSGISARKRSTAPARPPVVEIPSEPKPPPAPKVEPDQAADSSNSPSKEDNFDEMMKIMDDMGLGYDGNDLSGNIRELDPEIVEEEVLDEDEIDLR